LYAPEMSASSMERFLLTAALRLALVRNEFELHYQPQIDLTSGMLIGREALIRWRHPEMGLVSPARFIPLAEDSGLIKPIGAWVLREACMQNRRWIDAGMAPVPVAVNVSGVQLDGRMVEQVSAALAESGLPADLLELEVTESVLVENTALAQEQLQQLKQLGVQLSIDDFGTGYSSLAYLKRLPLGKLKIDQSFVRNLTEDANDQAICNAVVSMGHSLRLLVIAEGVETAAQARMLREMGCDEAQGYLIARPLPAAQVPVWRMPALDLGATSEPAQV
jgi:EAL domain-containing protein (putative c-di-GMP-specific phosphodiesterase class I)